MQLMRNSRLLEVAFILQCILPVIGQAFLAEKVELGRTEARRLSSKTKRIPSREHTNKAAERIEKANPYKPSSRPIASLFDVTLTLQVRKIRFPTMQ